MRAAVCLNIVDLSMSVTYMAFLEECFGKAVAI